MILYESVVTQENRSQPVQISRNLIGGEIQRGRPRLRFPVIPGIGEECLEFPDVTDGRLARAPVQPRRVPLLQAAVHGLGAKRLVMAEPAVLVEERREGRNPRGHRLHEGHWRTSTTCTDREHEDE